MERRQRAEARRRFGGHVPGHGEGWFRGDEYGRHNLERYFNEDADDPYKAREIINGDKSKVPSWSGGVSIGNLIKQYHVQFLAALEAALVETVSA
jgi:hypothetical protein